MVVWCIPTCCCVGSRLVRVDKGELTVKTIHTERNGIWYEAEARFGTIATEGVCDNNAFGTDVDRGGVRVRLIRYAHAVFERADCSFLCDLTELDTSDPVR